MLSTTPPNISTILAPRVRLKADPLVRFHGSRDWLDTGCAAQSLAAARTMPRLQIIPFYTSRRSSTRDDSFFFFFFFLSSLPFLSFLRLATSGFYTRYSFSDALRDASQPVGKFNSRRLRDEDSVNKLKFIIPS